MMTENTSAFRRVLEDLAHSRGLAGAEELAERAAAVDPSMISPQTLLEDPRGGYGNALDAVLGLSEDEKKLISAAFVETFMRSDHLPRAGGLED